MTIPDFIFVPSIWLGEGKISFNVSPEFLTFYTKWVITEKSSDSMEAIQTVEIRNIQEKLENHLIISHITPDTFTISLENLATGTLCGTGLRTAETIAWEFMKGTDTQGFESYEKQDNGDYFVHAEYGTEQYRTIIEGLIWRKG